MSSFLKTINAIIAKAQPSPARGVVYSVTGDKVVVTTNLGVIITSAGNVGSVKVGDSVRLSNGVITSKYVSDSNIPVYRV